MKMKKPQRRFGFDLLAHQAAEAVLGDVLARGIEIEAVSHEPARSPIEMLLVHAVYTYARLAETETIWTVYSRMSTAPDWWCTINSPEDHLGTIFMDGQVAIPEIGRVDYLVHVYSTWPRSAVQRPPEWRRLIIECDGHEFHDRTKEQASKDRRRDRVAALAGIDVFRFTDSDIWRDPWGCATQIVKWAEQGV